MNLVPLLGVWDGLSLNGPIITGDALDPYVDDVLNEIEVFSHTLSLLHVDSVGSDWYSTSSGIRAQLMVLYAPLMDFPIRGP